MVKVPPCISSGVSLPVRAFSESAASSAANRQDVFLVHIADHRHQQAAVGINGYSDVNVFFEDQFVGGGVDAGVEARVADQLRGHQFHQDHGDGHFGGGGGQGGVVLAAQALQFADVSLVALVDVGDGGPGAG